MVDLFGLDCYDIFLKHSILYEIIPAVQVKLTS